MIIKDLKKMTPEEKIWAMEKLWLSLDTGGKNMPEETFEENSEKRVCSSLEDLVIEELINSDFEIDSEAYAFCDSLLCKGRVRDYFQGLLDKLDWAKIEAGVKRTLAEIQGGNDD